MANLKAIQRLKATAAGSAARSGLNAPYFDLDSSIKVAEVIYNRGGGQCSADQLAAWLDYSTTRSGTYLTRVSAANKHFGVIEQNGDRFSITERGKTILAPVMPDDAVNAKVDAFMSVPLFAKVFENYRGSQLPPEVGLKNLFQNTFKILPDRVPQTVRVFMNSAEQAGFFLATGDRSRLVRPSSASQSVSKQAAPKEESDTPASSNQDRPKSGGGDGPSGVHSAIVGLLRELPAPGSPWPGKKRFKEAFMATLDFIYPEEDTP